MTHLRPAALPIDADAISGMRRSLRVAKAAEILDMEPGQVRKLIQSGEIDGHRCGKRGLRVYQDSIDDYRRRMHVGPTPEPSPAPARRRRGPSASALEAISALKAMGVLD